MIGKRIMSCRMVILVLLLRLRQACAHPILAIRGMRRTMDIPEVVSNELLRENNGGEGSSSKRRRPIDPAVFFERSVSLAASRLKAYTLTSKKQDAGTEPTPKHLAHLRYRKPLIDGECPVCLDDGTYYVAYPCRHEYCKRCKRTAVRNFGHHCPICAKPIDKIEFIPMATKAARKTHSSNNNNEKDNNRDSNSNEDGNSDNDNHNEKFFENESDIFEENVDGDLEVSDQYLYGVSPKLDVLLDHVKRDLLEGNKIVIVSQWTSLLDIIERNLEQIRPVVNYNRVDGRTPAMRRAGMVESFQTDPSVKICLLSLMAGAEGITLTAACRMYHTDIWWNPAKSLQASDRIHRIGQDKAVTITHLHAGDTIEDAVDELVAKKKILSEATVGEHSVTQDMSWIADIKLLFQLGMDNEPLPREPTL
eukprot:TRINITY_DN10555_c0_g2_i1.p1 TRINITY_DN10555_c0_g2~~TRINITY_DN10555_c0_g2_i1.p1  ORF type:complete len:456 (-),score=76.25 TRINITY_DN10555_c0_g2_i1:61-1323(-)